MPHIWNAPFKGAFCRMYEKQSRPFGYIAANSTTAYSVTHTKHTPTTFGNLARKVASSGQRDFPEKSYGSNPMTTAQSSEPRNVYSPKTCGRCSTLTPPFPRGSDRAYRGVTYGSNTVIEATALSGAMKLRG